MIHYDWTYSHHPPRQGRDRRCSGLYRNASAGAGHRAARCYALGRALGRAGGERRQSAGNDPGTGGAGRGDAGKHDARKHYACNPGVSAERACRAIDRPG